jgi:RNA recognition motif-containing protein
LYVREAKTKEQRELELQKSTYQFKKSMQLLNLVVKNLDPETTKQEFEEFFSQWGTLNNSKINEINEGAHIGFVSFQDRESARTAKEAAPKILFKNRKLIVNFCEPRESRRIGLEE